MNLSEISKDAYETARSKGWHDKFATFGDRIALCHSELSEALEAFRAMDNDSYDAIRQPIYRNTESGELTRDSGHYGIERWVLHKPEGVASELADVIIRIADMCGLYGINIESAVREKMEFNKTRPYRHGGKQL